MTRPQQTARATRTMYLLTIDGKPARLVWDGRRATLCQVVRHWSAPLYGSLGQTRTALKQALEGYSEEWRDKHPGYSVVSRCEAERREEKCYGYVLVEVPADG